MKAIELQTVGLEGLRLAERPIPGPRRGEIVVRMLAASINYRDYQIATGGYHVNFPLPLVPLSDGVGEVVAIGDDVTRFVPGERVAGSFWQRWSAGDFDLADPNSTLGGPIDGMLAEYVRLDEQGAVKVPAHLSVEEAASLPCAGVTAWRALVSEGHLKAGECVLVQGTGGVSMFALQFTKLFGARAIVTSRSAEKLERARTLGADAGIDTQAHPDWAARVLELTDGRGVDHVVDVGGPSSFVHTLRSLRVGGQVSVVGYLGGMQGELNPLQLLERQARVRGLQVGQRGCFEDMNRAIAQSKLRPVIDSVFSWTDLPNALRRLRSGQHFGKICLKF